MSTTASIPGRQPAGSTSAAASPAPAERVVERRTSLSRGPAMLVGTVLLAAGIYFQYRAHLYPRLGQFPSGTAHVEHKVFFGIFGVNGWTGVGTAIAGGLLLLGAAQHVVAKASSLVVGLCLAIAAAVALLSGDVFGLAAANGATELGWVACAALLLFNVMLPARRRQVAVAGGAPVTAPAAAAATPVATPVAPGASEPDEAPDGGPTPDGAASDRPRQVDYTHRITGGQRPTNTVPGKVEDGDAATSTAATGSTEATTSTAANGEATPEPEPAAAGGSRPGFLDRFRHRS